LEREKLSGEMCVAATSTIRKITAFAHDSTRKLFADTDTAGYEKTPIKNK
jgi:hypothetical protein